VQQLILVLREIFAFLDVRGEAREHELTLIRVFPSGHELEQCLRKRLYG